MPLLSRYETLVAEGRLTPDPAQRAIADRLNGLVRELQATALATKGNPLGWMFGRKVAPAVSPKGLYIHGKVGRGKTMLMDLFFAELPVPAKRRAHFHDFMADVHDRIHRWRQDARNGQVKGADPIAPTAAALARDARVLCFDEFSVTDIADAMILGRLFAALWAEGVTVVATSNVAPGDLYRDGLNRALFLPFIAELERRMEIVALDARTDYRMEKLGGEAVYLVPADGAAAASLDAIVARLSNGVPPQAAVLEVKGRRVSVPRAAGGVARFEFEDLCSRPLGASDYLAIARAFHTVVIDGIPSLGFARRNEAKRFITLIDVLYEYHVKLIASAEAPPQDLYRAETGAEAFEFHRTASRLIEMQSREYLGTPHGRIGAASADLGGLVET